MNINIVSLWKESSAFYWIKKVHLNFPSGYRNFNSPFLSLVFYSFHSFLLSFSLTLEPLFWVLCIWNGPTAIQQTDSRFRLLGRIVEPKLCIYNIQLFCHPNVTGGIHWLLALPWSFLLSICRVLTLWNQKTQKVRAQMKSEWVFGVANEWTIERHACCDPLFDPIPGTR